MSFHEHEEPPGEVRYSVEEALDLLAVLEEARDALITTDHLAEVSQLERTLQILNGRLGFDNGGSDG